MGCSPSTSSDISISGGGIGEKYGSKSLTKDSNTIRKLEKKADDLFNSNLDNYTEEILRGKITVDCPPTAKIVRIFTSSTFTDTKHERNYLMENIYPRLKEFCQDLGYEFQVVDMRWGVRDEATDDHMTTELCLKEVDLCNKLSTGPSFVTFLSHKYGYRDLPREMEAGEFEKLLDAVKTDEVKKLLSKWFTRDDNNVPPTYILQPISSKLPGFVSEVEDEKSQAKKQWNSEREEMRQGLVEAAKLILDSGSSHKYLRSVTETEIDRGLSSGGDRAYWFYRFIKDIESAKPSDVLRRYRECFGTDEYIEESHILLNKLREEKLKSRLPPDHIMTYPIHWTEKGIDPVSDETHKSYIERLGQDFETTIKTSVQKAIKQKKVGLLNMPLYQEVLQHIIFCQEKCKAFYGREETFKIIADYMTNELNNEPLIVHGESGSGKTSIMAMAVKNAWSTEVHQTTIIRFLGTTPDSSNIGSLLLSVINQIRTVYNQQLITSGLTLKKLAAEFKYTLELAMKARPLLLVLDSLDQLDVTGGARQLFWLPYTLPKHVKMIVCTLPDPEYECFPRLQSMFDNPDCFLPVSTLSNHDVEGILNKWLETNHRKLQEHQLKAVMDAFHQCPIPLFLKLTFDEACRWKSFTPSNQSVLNTTVRTVINNLFMRIEKLHGKLLVSRALGYLTLRSGGLTEAELEDILSCDDDVLNDVYMYWTPPIRRLPPLLLVRIKAELGQYFVDRGADGVQVFYWYHRQFIEAAYDRYCSDEKTRKKMHSVLADYFSGVWANGKKKPYTSKSGESLEADRFVAAQPFKFINKSNQSESLNLRKLNNLTHHRLHADQQELLKSECLCNFDFIFNKLKGSGLRPLLDDFFEAKQKYNEDEEIGSICDALQLSQRSLQYNPQELSSQFLGRLKSTKSLEKLLEDCKNTSFHYLLPSRSILVQPGGSLLYSLANHTNMITGLDLNKTGEIAVTCACDNTIQVISVKFRKLLKSFDIDGKWINPTNVQFDIDNAPVDIKFCNDDKTLMLSFFDFLLAVRYQTGLKQYTIEKEIFSYVGICGENKNIIGVFSGTKVVLHDAATGEMIRAVECEFMKAKNIKFDTYPPCAGSKRYMAVTANKVWVIVFDAETNLFLPDIHYEDDSYCYQHESVDYMVITPDCKQIIVLCKQFLLIYDIINMELVTALKGKWGYDLQITPDGKTLYFPFYLEVITVDMEKIKPFIAIHHPSRIRHVITLDMNTFVTTGNDRIVRIWDLSRTEGDFRKTTTDHKYIEKCILTENPRYTTMKRKITDTEYLLEVIDLSKNEVLKRDKFQLKGIDISVQYLEDGRYLLSNNTSVFLYNSKTSKIEKCFEGVIHKTASSIVQIFPSKKEFCVLSRGRKDLKIISIETGKIEIIPGFGERMEDIKINHSGTRAVCSIIGSKAALLIDLEKKQVLYELTAGFELWFTMESVIDDRIFLVTDDGQYFIYLTPKRVKDYKTTAPVVWHIELKKVYQRLCDEEYIKMYVADSRPGVSYDIWSLKLLDKSTLVSAHDDFILRIFNIETGTLLKRLFGHTRCMEVVVDIKSPFFVTYATKDENGIRVWDRETYEHIASYCLESGTRSVKISPDGYRIIVQPEKEYPFYFEVKGGQDNKYTPEKPLHQYEELFHPTDEIKEIELPSVDPGEMDTDDEPVLNRVRLYKRR